eukprot:m.452465 g.452465  ORF g.452465 m.452465 type:complete len:430 (-) comp20332_c0_seq1:9-1298(-)
MKGEAGTENVIPKITVVVVVAVLYYFASTNGLTRKGVSTRKIVVPPKWHQRNPGRTAGSSCSLPSDVRLLRVGFVDEQMGSGLKAVIALLRFAHAQNLTLVEPACGSAAANSNFHTTCPASPDLMQFQVLGSVYNLEKLAQAGFRILPLQTYWELERCGAIPPRVLLPGSWDNNGTCFSCEGSEKNITVFRHVNANRIHAGNRVMCGGQPVQKNWTNIVQNLDPGPAFFEACCIRKNDGASIGHFTNGMNMKKVPIPPLEFSLPRLFASRFIDRHNLTSGYVGVHWRSEKDHGWMKKGVDSTAARFVELIDAALRKSKLTKIFIAVDFLGTGSTTHNPNAKALAHLIAVVDIVTNNFHSVKFVPSLDFPDAVRANNNMLIAATEATILMRAAEFVPLKDGGSFVGLIKRERTAHVLDPLHHLSLEVDTK